MIRVRRRSRSRPPASSRRGSLEHRPRCAGASRSAPTLAKRRRRDSGSRPARKSTSAGLVGRADRVADPDRRAVAQDRVARPVPARGAAAAVHRPSPVGPLRLPPVREVLPCYCRRRRAIRPAATAILRAGARAPRARPTRACTPAPIPGSRSSSTARRPTHYDFGPEPPVHAAPLRPGHRPAARARAPSRVRGAARRRPTTTSRPSTTRDFLARIELLSDYPEVGRRGRLRPTADTPPFYGMHDAAATVVGGTLARDGPDPRRASALHAFHPGGGLHHAFPAPGQRVLRLQRRGRRDPPGARRRPPRALRGRRRPPRRRRRGDLLGRPARPDRLDPRDRPDAVPGHRLGRGPGRRRAPRGAPSTSRSSPARRTRRGSRCSSSWSRAVAAAFRPTLLVTLRRLATPRARPAREPGAHDGGVRGAPRGCSTRSRTSTRTVDGWRRAAAATTSTGSCRATGGWSGWRRRIARCPPRRRGWRSAGQPRRRGTARAPPPDDRCSTPPGRAPAEPAGVAERNRATAGTALEHTLRILRASGA